MTTGIIIFMTLVALAFSVDIVAKLAASLVVGIRDLRRESRKIKKEFNVNDDV